MSRVIAALYKKNNPGLTRLLQEAVNRGVDLAESTPMVFFRADDIGFVSPQYCTMIAQFKKYQVPLALAVVPSWMNEERSNALYESTGADMDLWCWHQHGYRHINFAHHGKKQEFGDDRSRTAIRNSLAQGQTKLSRLFGHKFTPIFTPPWNRCNEITIHELIALGFRAISRSGGAQPETPPQLVDLQVNVDLHTRKERDSEEGLSNLLIELEKALASGWCGIMLHHQRMNRRAYDFLDILLATLSAQAVVRITGFPSLMEILQERNR